MAKRRLPIGIQTFRRIRERNCYYVDKTAFIERLIDEGTHYFLSRPRRFGKSLFLDTLKELFEGNEALFKGLRIHDGWTWGEPNPVVRLDFAGGDYRRPSLLEDSLMDLLAAEERRHEVETDSRTVPGRFAHLLEVLHKRSGRRVVVLVDEYDKPILDMLGTPAGGERQPRPSAQRVRGDQGERRAHTVHVPDGSEQVFQGEPVLAAQQPYRHHAGPALLRDLRLHRGGSWTRCSPRSWPDWTASASASGTTGTAGWATRRCTTRLTCCCCSTAASSRRTGSRPGRRRS